MTELFNLAACKALHMSQPSPPKISIGIEISQPPMNGGLSSIQESMNIGGEPHQLSYINSDEASLLKQLGGSGQPVNGIPAYWAGEGWGSWDGPEQASADASAEAAAAQEADKAAEDEEGLMGMMDFDPAQFDYAHGIADYTTPDYKNAFQGYLDRTWQPYGMRFPPKPEDEMQKKPGVWEDTRKPTQAQKDWADKIQVGLTLATFPFLGYLAKQGILSWQEKSDLMTKEDKDDPDQMGMRDRDSAQFGEKDPNDYSETEGDRILKKSLKAARPCVPGEAGWPECEADVEEESAMSNYFSAMSEDSGDPTDENMIWWDSLPQDLKDILKTSYPEEGEGGIPEKLLADSNIGSGLDSVRIQ